MTKPIRIALNLHNCEKRKKIPECLFHIPLTPHENSELVNNSNNIENENKNKMECNICMDNDFNIVFQCGHCCCDACAINLKICHICRAKIVTRLQLHT